MQIFVEPYNLSLNRSPKTGQHILAHQTDKEIVFYQAYNPTIADFAIRNQILGGSAYSYNRMSWIKPNFLCMMYGCGWAQKENQERVLAIWISKGDFENILTKAVLSSFNKKHHDSHEQWKHQLDISDVRLQWDPDHDPFGSKLDRRAIQIGLKGNNLKKFGQEQIKRIEDITDFVKEQKLLLDQHGLNALMVPVETVF